MGQFLHLKCARSQEIIAIRPGEVETRCKLWPCHPLSHNAENLDRARVVVLNPKAQEVLCPCLDRDPESHCFVPAETSVWDDRRLRLRLRLRAPLYNRIGLTIQSDPTGPDLPGDRTSALTRAGGPRQARAASHRYDR